MGLSVKEVNGVWFWVMGGSEKLLDDLLWPRSLGFWLPLSWLGRLGGGERLLDRLGVRLGRLIFLGSLN